MAESKHEAMTEEELVAMIVREVADSDTESDDTPAVQAAASGFANAHLPTYKVQPNKGKSKVLMYYTPMANNTLVMHQSKIFCSDKDTFKFEPRVYTEESKAAADQLEKMVKAVFYSHNNGFNTISNMLQSAAWYKNGWSKVAWEEKMEMFEELYQDLDPLSLQQVVTEWESQGYDVEIVEESVADITEVQQTIDPTTGIGIEEGFQAEIGDFVLRLSKMKGNIDISVVPFEEVTVNENTTHLHDDPNTYIVAHTRDMSRSEVLELINALDSDVDVDELASDSNIDDNFVKWARHVYDGSIERYHSAVSPQGVDKIAVSEAWVKADMDGDGYDEWIHAYIAGRSLLHQEPWYGPLPWSTFTFFQHPHKLVGQSTFDVIGDLDAAATNIFRSMQDHARLSNQYRFFVREGAVDADALESGQDGPIYVDQAFKMGEDIGPIITPQGSGKDAQNLQIIRDHITGEIGIDPINGAVSAKIEDSGNDAEKTAMSMDNATTKIEGMARRFAEGPLRDMAWQIIMELVRHKDSEYVMRLVQSVTPEAVDEDGMPMFYAGELGFQSVMEKTDIVAMVGLGHMSGHQKIAASASLGALVTQLEQAPSKALYMVTKEAIMGWGFPNVEEFIDPYEVYEQKAAQNMQTQQSAVQAQQTTAQTQQGHLQLQQQQAQQDYELKKMEAEFRMKLDQQESIAKIEETKAKTAKLQSEKMQLDKEIELMSTGTPEVTVRT